MSKIWGEGGREGEREWEKDEWKKEREREMQVSTGVYRWNLSKVVIPLPYVHTTFVPFPSLLYFFKILCPKWTVESVHLAELVAYQELLSIRGWD